MLLLFTPHQKQKMKGFTSPSCIIYCATRWEKTGMFWLKIPHRCCSLRWSLDFVACGHWGRTSGTIIMQEPEPVQTCEEAATVPCSGKHRLQKVKCYLCRRRRRARRRGGSTTSPPWWICCISRVMWSHVTVDVCSNCSILSAGVILEMGSIVSHHHARVCVWGGVVKGD